MPTVQSMNSMAVSSRHRVAFTTSIRTTAARSFGNSLVAFCLLALSCLLCSSHAAPAAVHTNINTKHTGSLSAISDSISISKVPSLQWDTTNRLFNDQTNSGANFYLKLTGHWGDKIDLVCPRHAAETHSSSGSSSSSLSNTNQAEYSIIYRVGSKHEFDNCIINLNSVETVPILKCDKPSAHNAVKLTTYFVKFSPIPNALEFEEGREYYFLSTSSGSRDGLGFMSGGLCSKYNMRFSLRVTTAQPAAQPLGSAASHAAHASKQSQHHAHAQQPHHHEQQQHQQSNVSSSSLLSKLFLPNSDDRNEQPKIVHSLPSTSEDTSLDANGGADQTAFESDAVNGGDSESGSGNEAEDDAIGAKELHQQPQAQVSKLNLLVSSHASTFTSTAQAFQRSLLTSIIATTLFLIVNSN